MITLLAALSLNGLLPTLIQLVIVGLILWVLMWFVGYIGLPEPFNRVAKILIALIAVVYLIQLLLTLT